MRRGELLCALVAMGCGAGPSGEEAPPVVDPFSPPPARAAVAPGPAGAAAAEPSAPSSPLAAEPFTIVVLPDTQFYSQSFPEIFQAQTKWIAANREAHRIAFVAHEGDIVNADEPLQWERASKSLRVLDGVVPYALAKGNHDLAGGSSRLGGLMNAYFPVSEFLRYSWFRETFEINNIDNSFLLVDVAGQKWAILALEFGPRDAVLAWADQILRRYASTPTIVVTHAYLYNDNTRYDHQRLTGPPQHWGPHELSLEGGANDGEEMWQKLISKHDNVRFVLSGHVPEKGVGSLTSTRPSGSRCHQLLANYQAFGQGGDGFLRLMRVEPAAGRVVVRTYSPYLDKYKSEPEHDFVLPLD